VHGALRPPFKNGGHLPGRFVWRATQGVSWRQGRAQRALQDVGSDKEEGPG
jgi:hypothetical protein